MASAEFEMGHHLCCCVRACAACVQRRRGMGPGLLPFASAASRQPDVVYGPSCPLWVCLWIPIEWRIMATPGRASQKQQLHHCSLALPVAIIQHGANVSAGKGKKKDVVILMTEDDRKF